MSDFENIEHAFELSGCETYAEFMKVLDEHGIVPVFRDGLESVDMDACGPHFDRRVCELDRSSYDYVLSALQAKGLLG